MTYLLEKYTKHEIEDYSKTKRVEIAKDKEHIYNFIENALAGNKTGKKLLLGKIGKGTAKRIKNESGAVIDLTGFNLELRADEIRHLFKEHGNAKTENPRGQRAITIDDVANFANIVQNFDKVAVSGFNGLKFVKKANGRISTITLYAEGNKSLSLKTMWVNVGGGLGRATNAQRALDTTFETASETATAPDTVRKKLGSCSRLSSESSDLTELGPLVPSNQGTHPVGGGLGRATNAQRTLDTTFETASETATATNNIQNSKNGGKAMSGQKNEAKTFKAMLQVFKPDPKKPVNKIYQLVEGAVILTRYSISKWRFQIPNDTSNYTYPDKNVGFIKKNIWTSFKIEGYPASIGYLLRTTKETYDRFIKLQPGQSVRFDLVDNEAKLDNPVEAKPEAKKIKEKRNKEIERRIKKDFPGIKDRVIVTSPEIPKPETRNVATEKEPGIKSETITIPKSSPAYKKIIFVAKALAKSTYRPALNYLNIERSDGTTDIVATDSHILNWAKFETGEELDIDCLAPGLYKIIATKNEAVLTRVSVDSVFPNWHIAIPKEEDFEEVKGEFNFYEGKYDYFSEELSKGYYSLARAGYCTNIDYLKRLSGFSWGARVNKEKSLAFFNTFEGDCKSLVMGIKVG